MHIDVCPVCFGAWFDHGELDALGDGAFSEAELRSDARASRRACPRAHGPMQRFRLPREFGDAGLDRCPTCEGVWLDGQERARFARRTTREGQQSLGERAATRGAIWVAQLLTKLPVEVENPARSTPYAVLLLLSLFVGGFALELAGNLSVAKLGLDPSVHGEYGRLLSYIFVHGGIGHLLGNAYFLYVFGDNVEHLFGRLRFLLFFVACGVFAGATQLWFAPADARIIIGASGAVAGVLGAYVLSFPRARLFHVIFFVQLKLPAYAYVLAWFAVQIVMAIRGDHHETAWVTHIGGLVAGLALTPLMHAVRRAEVRRGKTPNA